MCRLAVWLRFALPAANADAQLAWWQFVRALWSPATRAASSRLRIRTCKRTLQMHLSDSAPVPDIPEWYTVSGPKSDDHDDLTFEQLLR
jgi:hypothetical protein